jgi:hypothetical protein
MILSTFIIPHCLQEYIYYEGAKEEQKIGLKAISGIKVGDNIFYDLPTPRSQQHRFRRKILREAAL